MQIRTITPTTILFFFLFAITGCNAPTPTPVIEQTATQITNSAESTSTPPLPTEIATSLTLFNTATPTPTPIPTDTPTRVPTKTPTPTSTPVPTIPSETVIEVEGVTLPPGFSLIKFAEMDQPTAIDFDPQGRMLVTSRGGDIFILSDTDGDGRSDTQSKLSYGFDEPVGIVYYEPTNAYYVSSKGKISILRDTDGDLVADEVENFINGLPSNLHKNNNLKFGPDGWLYMGVGSTCDVCEEEDERSATIMRFNIETAESEIYATGLRNSFDLVFDPETGDLFATENGRDDLGLDAPQEELNHIIKGGNYGWPECWDVFQGSGCKDTIKAIGFFESRSSTNSLDFYMGDRFPAEYHHVLFAGVFGSWVDTETERGIWQIRLKPDGDSYLTEKEWFARWPDGWILGLRVGPDGALYVGDYMNGGIYRISYGLP